jgi:hypothetical protein
MYSVRTGRLVTLINSIFPLHERIQEIEPVLNSSTILEYVFMSFSNREFAICRPTDGVTPTPIKMNARQVNAGSAHNLEVLRHLANNLTEDIPRNISNARPNTYVRKIEIISGNIYVDTLKKKNPLPATTINASTIFIVDSIAEDPPPTDRSAPLLLMGI